MVFSATFNNIKLYRGSSGVFVIPYYSWRSLLLVEEIVEIVEIVEIHRPVARH
jgi:hypothetical protein